MKSLLMLTLAGAFILGLTIIAKAQSGGCAAESSHHTECVLEDEQVTPGSGGGGPNNRPSGGETPVWSIFINWQATPACWFIARGFSNYTYAGVQGSLTYFYYDPYRNFTGPLTPPLPPCPSSATTTTTTIDPTVIVIQRTADIYHQDPVPRFDPQVPNGLVWLETRAVVPVPSPQVRILTAGSHRLEARVRVQRVGIDWGDGARTTKYPGSESSILFTHTYEQKTCSPPGGPRCHRTLSAYPVRTWFVWEVRWRFSSDRSWRFLTVANTRNQTNYPVREIIATITS